MSDSRVVFDVAEKPRVEFLADVGDGHQVYVQEFGIASGIPVVVCHGGPGAGCPPAYAGFFNPEVYRIVLIDQRGAGKSLPKGELRDNRTSDLIADMEKIREVLRIEQWVVFGGSWGTTLGVLYAQKYPQQVLGLILRGVFLARKKDSECFLGERTWAAEVRPREWEEFTAQIDELVVRAGLPAADNYLDAVLSLLKYDEVEVKDRAAAALATWEYAVSFRYPPPMPEDFTLGGFTMALIELTYIKNNCYLTENWLLEHVPSLPPKLPVYIIHGEYDYICPKEQAILLAKALHEQGCQVEFQLTQAGHAGMEPDNMHFIVMATIHLANKLQNEKLLTGKYSNCLFAPPPMLRISTVANMDEMDLTSPSSLSLSQ
jgi:proline iminopeptidase